MDDEEDQTADEFTGAPRDVLTQLAVRQEAFAKAEAQARQARQQLLQQGIEALKARRTGPTLSEQLLRLSAAFVQPVRGGFGGVMANVMPVLAQNAAETRTAREAQQDRLMALQRQYALDEADANVGAAKHQIDALRVAASLSRQPQPWKAADTLGRGVTVYENGVARLVPFSNEPGGQSVLEPRSRAEIDAYPPGTLYRLPDGTTRRKGGPTGSAPSGGFRP